MSKQWDGWPAYPPPQYLGQLTDKFQALLASERSNIARDECDFYHTVELPNGEVVDGPWDLRGHEHEYLGGVNVRGKRVLELGPATGALTYFMERAGADVVGFDAGWDVSIDLQPHPGNEDLGELRMDHGKLFTGVQKSWWYLHQQYASQAKVAYGDIYALPGDFGEFDISVFAAILLHLRSPISALEQAARRTRETLVVTEPWSFGRETLHENIMRTVPWGDNGRWTVWWEMSAGAVLAMFDLLGFRKTEVFEHSQRHQFGHDRDAQFRQIEMYTVVGHR
jgi:O-methyltransferase